MNESFQVDKLQAVSMELHRYPPSALEKFDRSDPHPTSAITRFSV